MVKPSNAASTRLPPGNVTVICMFSNVRAGGREKDSSRRREKRKVDPVSLPVGLDGGRRGPQRIAHGCAYYGRHFVAGDAPAQRNRSFQGVARARAARARGEVLLDLGAGGLIDLGGGIAGQRVREIGTGRFGGGVALLAEHGGKTRPEIEA